MLKIVSGNHPYIPTPPLLYGGSELEASLTANALIEAGYDVCLEANKRSFKIWDYYFTTPPPKPECKDVSLTISYINEADIHVFQGRPFQINSFKVFITEPQKEYYEMILGLDENEYTLIPNTIPEWFYEPRNSWDDGDYYLFLNRCDDNKGCKEFVEWCVKNNLKCKMITQFWFVKDINYALNVVNYAKKHGVEVLVNVDPISKIELIKNAKAVVAFLSKKYFEGYGIWVHEANWLRVPVISTNVPSVPWTMMKGELVKYADGKTETIQRVDKDENEWRRDRSYNAYKERWINLLTSSPPKGRGFLSP